MKRLLSVLITSIVVAGCAMTSARGESDVRFEIRGFELRTQEDTYGTSYTVEGVIVAQGDTAALRQPYLLMVRFNLLSGGDPDSKRPNVEYGFFEVIDGDGKIAVSGGYRPKANAVLGREGETWQPPRYEARIVGYVPFTPVNNQAVSY